MIILKACGIALVVTITAVIIAALIKGTVETFTRRKK